MVKRKWSNATTLYQTNTSAGNNILRQVNNVDYASVIIFGTKVQ